MIVSLNELDAAMRKAFRGAGYQWGEAEDAGKAVVWLAPRGVAFIAPVVELLQQTNTPGRAMAPMIGSAIWRAPNHRLCPIRCGIAVMDRAGELKAGDHITFEDVVSPILLMPFIAQAADTAAARLELAVPGCCMAAEPGMARVQIEAVAMQLGTVTLRIGKPGDLTREAPAPLLRTAALAPEDWQEINRFAGLTYVPASEHSRLAGAGAGVADND